MGISIAPPGPEDTIAPQKSRSAIGSQTGPGAGGVIVNISTIAGLVYRVDVLVQLTGTLTAAELNNVKVVNGGTSIALIPTDNAVAAAQESPAVTCFAIGDGNPISVQAIAAAGVAAVYSAALIVTQIG